MAWISHPLLHQSVIIDGEAWPIIKVKHWQLDLPVPHVMSGVNYTMLIQINGPTRRIILTHRKFSMSPIFRITHLDNYSVQSLNIRWHRLQMLLSSLEDWFGVPQVSWTSLQSSKITNGLDMEVSKQVVGYMHRSKAVIRQWLLVVFHLGKWK